VQLLRAAGGNPKHSPADLSIERIVDLLF